MLAQHRYEFDKIIIGSDLDAVLFANKTSSCILFNNMASIFPFDTIDNEISMGQLTFRKGTATKDVYERLSYELNLKGLNFLSAGLESIRVNLIDREISISSKFFPTKYLRFKSLHIFDTDNVHGLGIPDFKIQGYRVFDWFSVKSGMSHKYDKLQSESDFVKQIYFYISKRISGNKRYKDLVSESFLSMEQLKQVEYSDSIARLKIMNMMNSAGIKGTSKSKSYNLPIDIYLQKRDVVPLKIKKIDEEGVIL